MWAQLFLAMFLAAGAAAAQSKPENEFLKTVADAVKSNDVEKLVSMIHPVVLESFGQEACAEAFSLPSAPGMVIAGRAVKSTTATWTSVEGRTQILPGVTPFRGAITTMERGKVTGMANFAFVKDNSGSFHLVVDCNEKFITEQ